MPSQPKCKKQRLTEARMRMIGQAYKANSFAALGRSGRMADYATMHNFGTPVAADRDGVVAAAQVSVDGGASMTLTTTAGVSIGASFDASNFEYTTGHGRVVTFYSSGNLSGITFTITGTDLYGDAVVETITGPNADTVYGAKGFAVVTDIASNDSFGTNVEVGFCNRLSLPYAIEKYQQVSIHGRDSNGLEFAPYSMVLNIQALGTADTVDAAVPSPGVISDFFGVSAADNGTSAAGVTLSDAGATIGTLSFSASYSAGTVVADTTYGGIHEVSAQDVLRVVTDGDGDGGGELAVTVFIQPYKITTFADATTVQGAGDDDVRGVIDFGGGFNGTNEYYAVFHALNDSSKEGLFGYAQYGG